MSKAGYFLVGCVLLSPLLVSVGYGFYKAVRTIRRDDIVEAAVLIALSAATVAGLHCFFVALS